MATIAARKEVKKAELIYPAATVTVSTQHVKIRCTGFHGSAVMPLQTSLHRTAASVFGRMASLLIRGSPVDGQERELLSWLRSPLFIGGMSSSTT